MEHTNIQGGSTPQIAAKIGTPGGGSLNVYSAEFQRPMSNPNILTQEQTQKQININSKEFMPSKQNEAFASKKVLNQSQI